ncbi:uncharacterized protein [Amphiura filiformis]|uniref:uncharacterized protein n=1 Tax=Amphiura filiformis TaxID=82378 RepID=UPI003B2103BF
MNDKGPIIGGIAGALLLLCILITVVVIVRRRTNNSQQSDNKNETTGPTSITATDNVNPVFEPQTPENNDDDEYQEINDQSQEYAYAYVDGQRPVTRNTESSNAYAYAETNREIVRPSAPVAESREAEEGWMDNTVYVSSGNGDGDTRPTDGNSQEGWMDNTVYVSSGGAAEGPKSDADDNGEEGWMDNSIYDSD